MKTDVIVVGAGPAGCVLSYLLARSGIQTVLVERHTELDREFRGYFFQPLVMKLFDQMGLLQDILRLEHEKVDAFHFIDHGRELFAVRFDDLPEPYNYGINLPQPPLLRFLIDRAQAFSNFTYLDGASASKLLMTGGQSGGLVIKRGGQSVDITSRLVVGADGRFSTIRKLAGIEQQVKGVPFDFIWFDLPNPEHKRYPLSINIEDSGLLIYIPMGRDRVQVGWFIPKGGYKALREAGLDHFRDRLIAADPALRESLHQYLTDFKQCSVLDVEDAIAQTWAKDGVLLIGDAAHVASPFSGQGNSLAIQDAVVAHRVIIDELHMQHGILMEVGLRAFEEVRRPAVEEIKHIQAMQTQLVTADSLFEIWLRRLGMTIIKHTPRFDAMRAKLALGAIPLHVATQYFVQDALAHN